jgi:hypothetical protein
MKLVQIGKMWRLQGAITPGGNTVESRSAPLMDKIFTEYQERGRLDATKFGIFSIYCSCRDFVHGKSVFDEKQVSSNLRYDHILGGGCGIQGCTGHFDTTRAMDNCRRLFAAQGWDQALLDNPQQHLQEIAKLFAKYLQSIPEEVQTAVVLLEGMRSADISLLMLFLNGYYDIENFKANPFQIDSEESMEAVGAVGYISEWLAIHNWKPPLNRPQVE